METRIGRAYDMLTRSPRVLEVRTRHRDYYLELAETADAEMHGPEQNAWLDVLDAEHDNLRAALEWSLQEGDGESALRLAVALAEFWEVRGHRTEGRSCLERALAASPEPSGRRARALERVADLAHHLGDWGAGGPLLDEALEVARNVGDDREVAWVLCHRSYRAWVNGSWPAARSIAEEALAVARESGDRVVVAQALRRLGAAIQRLETPERSRPVREEALAIYRELGDKRWVASSLSELARACGPAEATALRREALGLFRELNDDYRATWELEGLGWIALYSESVPAARAAWEEAVQIERTLDSGYVDYRLYCAGLAAQAAGDLAKARARFEEARDLRGMNFNTARRALALLALAEGDADEAVSLLQRVLEGEATSGPPPAYALYALGTVLIARGDVGARTVLEDALEAARELGDVDTIGRALTALGFEALARNDLVAARTHFEEAPSPMGLAEVALREGDPERAAGLHRRALADLRHRGDRYVYPWCFEGRARVESARSRPDAAACLLGAAESFRERFGCVRSAVGPFMRAILIEPDDYEQRVEALRAALGEDAFRAAWDEGRAMSEDDALAYAARA